MSVIATVSRIRHLPTLETQSYRPQVAVALQRLVDRLERIEAGGAEVVSPRRA